MSWGNPCSCHLQTPSFLDVSKINSDRMIEKLGGRIEIGQWGTVLNLDRVVWYHSEGGDALEQVAQRGCGCPIPGDIQGQARLGVVLGSLV